MATAMNRPPTEAEIRQAIEDRLGDEAGHVYDEQEDLWRGLERVAIGAADPLVDSAARTLEASGGSVWEPRRKDVGPRALWSDLRPSQASRLMELVGEATERAATRARAVVLEEIVAAGLAFAGECMDASATEAAS